MACQSDKRMMPCGLCKDEYKVFQMWESDSPPVDDGPSSSDKPDERKTKKARICHNYELQQRQKIPPADRPEEGYCKQSVVVKAMKWQNKGKQWLAQGMQYKEAIAKVAQMETPMTQGEKAGMKTQMAKEISQSFVAVLKSGHFFNASVNAGNRIRANTSISDKPQKLYEAYLATPNDESLAKLQELEEAEEAMITATEYTAFDGNPELLKAADYHNKMDPNLNIFELC